MKGIQAKLKDRFDELAVSDDKLRKVQETRSIVEEWMQVAGKTAICTGLSLNSPM